MRYGAIFQPVIPQTWQECFNIPPNNCATPFDFLGDPPIPCKLVNHNVSCLPLFLSFSRSLFVRGDLLHGRGTVVVVAGESAVPHDGLWSVHPVVRAEPHRFLDRDRLGKNLRKSGNLLLADLHKWIHLCFTKLCICKKYLQFLNLGYPPQPWAIPFSCLFSEGRIQRSIIFITRKIFKKNKPLEKL